MKVRSKSHSKVLCFPPVWSPAIDLTGGSCVLFTYPTTQVKNAMNEINSSKRLKFAVAERAEGEKILEVKRAEVRNSSHFCIVYHRKQTLNASASMNFSQAEANAKYLSGVGVAKQRKAIVDGLRTSIVNFNENVEGSNTKDVMDLLLLTQVRLLCLKTWLFGLFGCFHWTCSHSYSLFSAQYFDMIRDVGGSGHCRTTFVPTSRTAADDIRNALLQAESQKWFPCFLPCWCYITKGMVVPAVEVI